MSARFQADRRCCQRPCTPSPRCTTLHRAHPNSPETIELPTSTPQLCRYPRCTSSRRRTRNRSRAAMHRSQYRCRWDTMFLASRRFASIPAPTRPANGTRRLGGTTIDGRQRDQEIRGDHTAAPAFEQPPRAISSTENERHTANHGEPNGQSGVTPPCGGASAPTSRLSLLLFMLEMGTSAAAETARSGYKRQPAHPTELVAAGSPGIDQRTPRTLAEGVLERRRRRLSWGRNDDCDEAIRPASRRFGPWWGCRCGPSSRPDLAEAGVSRWPHCGVESAAGS